MKKNSKYSTQLRALILASSGESVGDWRGSALRLSEESVEFAAGRVEGALRLLVAVVNQRAAVSVDGIAQQTVGRDLSQRRVVVQVADDLSTQQPQVVHVLSDGLGGQTR